MTNQNHQPGGQPNGGQFAPKAHPEGPSLTAGGSDAHLAAVSKRGVPVDWVDPATGQTVKGFSLGPMSDGQVGFEAFGKPIRAVAPENLKPGREFTDYQFDRDFGLYPDALSERDIRMYAAYAAAPDATPDHLESMSIGYKHGRHILRSEKSSGGHRDILMAVLANPATPNRALERIEQVAANREMFYRNIATAELERRANTTAKRAALGIRRSFRSFIRIFNP